MSSTLNHKPIDGEAATAYSQSYSQILRTSALFGGAEGIQYLVALLRTKAAAELLGPAGIGLVSAYSTLVNAWGTICGLGVSESGVREIAAVHKHGNRLAVATTAKVITRSCVLAGLLGWLAMVLFADQINIAFFGGAISDVSIRVAGMVILLNLLSRGQGALLQGLGRYQDLVLSKIISAAVSAVLAITTYFIVGDRAILAVVVGVSAVNLVCSWWFARRLVFDPVEVSLAASVRHAWGLLSLGLGLMWGSAASLCSDLALRSLIIGSLGLAANGVYQAAWSVSGLFLNFILSAMGTDYYPRLAAAAGDNTEFNQLVNEQTEVGVILATPAVVGSLAFAPWLISCFYSSEFAAAADLLPWFSLAVFFRVASWPLGYVQLGKSAGAHFAGTQTLATVLRLVSGAVGLVGFGLKGVAVAAVLHGLAYLMIAYCVARRLSGFRWSHATNSLLIKAFGAVAAAFLVQQSAVGWVAHTLGAMLCSACLVVSCRQLAQRLGRGHRWVVAVKSCSLRRLLTRG